MDELTELWVGARRTPAGASAAALLERCWPESPTPELGRRGRGRRAPRGPDALHRVRRDAGQRPLAHAPPARTQYLERRAQEIDATEPRRARAHPGPRRGGVEAARAGRDRARAPAAARVLRPHAHLPRHASTTTRQRHRALLGQRRRRHRPGGGEEARGPRAGGAGRARPRGEDAGARELRRLLHHRRPGGCCDRLRRLGFRVHWPGWVMCSVPLPGLDRYLADAPRARLL